MSVLSAYLRVSNGSIKYALIIMIFITIIIIFVRDSFVSAVQSFFFDDRLSSVCLCVSK